MAWFRKQSRQLPLPGMEPPRRGRRSARGRGGPGRVSRLRGSLTKAPMTRRRFLEGTLGWVTVAIGAALGIPALVAWISPSLRKADEGWVPIGSLTDPGPGQPDLSVLDTPIATSYTKLVEDAYLAAQPQPVAVFVINHGDGKFTIFDDRCTHLGCPFNWDGEQQRFGCPCHNGMFDEQGKVVGGPPPRPLDRYEYRVTNGVLYAGKLYQVNDRLERITQ